MEVLLRNICNAMEKEEQEKQGEAGGNIYYIIMFLLVCGGEMAIVTT